MTFVLTAGNISKASKSMVWLHVHVKGKSCKVVRYADLGGNIYIYIYIYNYNPKAILLAHVHV